MTTPDKRKFRRVPMVAKISGEAGGKPYLVEARNISVGGMLLHTAMTLAENQRLRLKFTLPGAQEEISAIGVVQHVSPDAFMGVRFEGLTPQALAAIERYVRESAEST